MGSKTIGAALGVVATLLVGIAIWLSVAYNVAATDMHADAVRWTLDTTMHRSVSSRAQDIDLPESVSDGMLSQGAEHYAASCAHCHGGPGVEPATWSRGMRPEPPHLVEAAAEWEPKEIYWIAENGIKMSGMPAFGPHHGREELLAITAFVSQLPGLSPEDYTAMTSGGGHGGTAAHSE
ncbi:cytochrome c [Loktanella sp. SALINAS62]|uniref:c-type cytochrome n=1 Tax=Loktanella sp. SALINAS62 TaxID=2706124 RepID=UPI001B8D6974|nr:cytochrome c [Loktanella sp. SALINAS62]MBS1303449.1 cytochrome c [Loktanella sp. SALINAS62]